MLDKVKHLDQSSSDKTLTKIFKNTAVIHEDTAASLDCATRNLLAKATRGMSPISLVMAYIDWLGHLALSPGKLVLLTQSLIQKCLEFGIVNVAALLGQNIKLPVGRMQGDHWQRWPFNVFAKGHQLANAWVGEASRGVVGIKPANEKLIAFLAEQILEVLSPANYPLTNPEVITATFEERGANLIRGMQYLIDDLERKRREELPAGTDKHKVGVDIGITPGKVVYQNRLIELIQYEPTTKKVAAEPVFIIPAWIMRYYILDLSPENSLVKYLLDQGKTVFIISWKNPREEDRNIGFNDYLKLGIMRSLDAIETITGSAKIHATGYCLGGTLLSIAAAYMAREGDERLKSISTFTAQIDFTEAGEVMMFLNESAFGVVESAMHKRGYMSMESMVGAFQILQSAQLIYAPAIERYFLGNDNDLNDLMTWNSDGTRMPHRMQSEYLRSCYLDNDLAEARYLVDDKPVSVGDIRVPAFVLATNKDHVAPWKSVYKATRLLGSDITFALSSGGHNGGVVAKPVNPRRSYQIGLHKSSDNYIDPDTWVAQTELQNGSWWSAWNAWLDEQTSATTAPPSIGNAEAGFDIIRDAPGEYVFS